MRPSSCSADTVAAALSNRSMSYIATSNELSMGKSLTCHCQLVRGAGFQTSVSVPLSETLGAAVVGLGTAVADSRLGTPQQKNYGQNQKPR